MDCKNSIILQEPPLNVKNHVCYGKLYEKVSCNVSVIWVIYDKNKKTIIKFGQSRPCGINHRRASIHAEQLAIEYCRSKKKNYEIYIWRYSKVGKIKEKYCCKSCTQLAEKYKYTNKIFTFVNGCKCSAVITEPPLSRCYKTVQSIL